MVQLFSPPMYTQYAENYIYLTKNSSCLFFIHIQEKHSNLGALLYMYTVHEHMCYICMYSVYHTYIHVYNTQHGTYLRRNYTQKIGCWKLTNNISPDVFRKVSVLETMNTPVWSTVMFLSVSSTVRFWLAYAYADHMSIYMKKSWWGQTSQRSLDSAVSS